MDTGFKEFMFDLTWVFEIPKKSNLSLFSAIKKINSPKKKEEEVFKWKNICQGELPESKKETSSVS